MPILKPLSNLVQQTDCLIRWKKNEDQHPRREMDYGILPA